MKKGGFNMYMMKDHAGTELYRSFIPKYTKYTNTEIEVHVSHSISKDMTKQMQSTVRSMSQMITHGFTRGGN